MSPPPSPHVPSAGVPTPHGSAGGSHGCVHREAASTGTCGRARARRPSPCNDPLCRRPGIWSPGQNSPGGVVERKGCSGKTLWAAPPAAQGLTALAGAAGSVQRAAALMLLVAPLCKPANVQSLAPGLAAAQRGNGGRELEPGSGGRAQRCQLKTRRPACAVSGRPQQPRVPSTW